MARLRKYVGRDATLAVGTESPLEFKGKMQVYDVRDNPETFGHRWRNRYNTWRGNHLHYKFITSSGKEIPVHSSGKNRVRVLSHVTDTPTIHFHIPYYRGDITAVA